MRLHTAKFNMDNFYLVLQIKVGVSCKVTLI
jgi:hypothetical protein